MVDETRKGQDQFLPLHRVGLPGVGSPVAMIAYFRLASNHAIALPQASAAASGR